MIKEWIEKDKERIIIINRNFNEITPEEGVYRIRKLKKRKRKAKIKRRKERKL